MKQETKGVSLMINMIDLAKQMTHQFSKGWIEMGNTVESKPLHMGWQMITFRQKDGKFYAAMIFSPIPGAPLFATQDESYYQTMQDDFEKQYQEGLIDRI